MEAISNSYNMDDGETFQIEWTLKLMDGEVLNFKKWSLYEILTTFQKFARNVRYSTALNCCTYCTIQYITELL